MINCPCGCCDDPVYIANKREVRQLLQDCANFLRDYDKPALALGLDDLMSELGLV